MRSYGLAGGGYGTTSTIIITMCRYQQPEPGWLLAGKDQYLTCREAWGQRPLPLFSVLLPRSSLTALFKLLLAVPILFLSSRRLSQLKRMKFPHFPNRQIALFCKSSPTRNGGGLFRFSQLKECFHYSFFRRIICIWYFGRIHRIDDLTP